MSSVTHPLVAGRYRLEAILGRDGESLRWRAVDPRLDRPVVVTFLDGPAVADPERRRRFDRRARDAARVHHPNLLAIHDVGGVDEVPYLVTEAAPGRTLAERLAAGALPAMQVSEVSDQVASALRAAHQAGLVHGHLTPEQVWLTDDGVVKVAGLGLEPPRLAAGPAARQPDPREDLAALRRLLAPLPAPAVGETTAVLPDLGALRGAAPERTRTERTQVLPRIEFADDVATGPEAGRRRSPLLLAGSLVAVVAVALGFFLGSHAGSSSGPTPAASAGAGGNPPAEVAAPTSAPPTTPAAPAEQLAALWSQLQGQLDSGALDPESAAEIAKRIQEANRQLSRGQWRKAADTLRGVREKLVDEGGAGGTVLPTLDELLRRLPQKGD